MRAPWSSNHCGHHKYSGQKYQSLKSCSHLISKHVQNEFYRFSEQFWYFRRIKFVNVIVCASLAYKPNNLYCLFLVRCVILWQRSIPYRPYAWPYTILIMSRHNNWTHRQHAHHIVSYPHHEHLWWWTSPRHVTSYSLKFISHDLIIKLPPLLIISDGQFPGATVHWQDDASWRYFN